MTQAELLTKAADQINQLTQELEAQRTQDQELTEKVAFLEKEQRAEKLARQMLRQGILEDEEQVAAKVAELKEQDDEQLDTTEKALGMLPEVAHGFKVASDESQGDSPRSRQEYLDEFLTR